MDTPSVESLPHRRLQTSLEEAHVSEPAEKTAPARKPGLLGDLLSLTKPRLSALVWLTAGGGVWLAPGAVSGTRAALAIGGTILVVAGANALNNYLERESDRFMARTASRPLPSDRLPPVVALVMGLLLSVFSVGLLTLGTRPLAGLLAAIALVLYVVVYTPLKRRSSVSTLVGAIPGALPPLIGWASVTGRADMGGLALFAVLFLWQIPHSLAIGLYRQSEYEQAGLKVFPIDHGEEATRRQMVLYTLPLVPLPLVLVHLGIANAATLGLGSLLGFGFLYLVWRGYRDGAGVRWARQVFLYSLLYLNGLFAALAVDKALF